MALPKGAGELRDRISVLRRVRTRDGIGGATETEELVLTAWASVNVLYSRDNVIAGERRDIRTHEVILRRGRNPVPMLGDVVAWGGGRLEVRSTRPIAHWLMLDCVTEAR
jgi:head-tail adaptor